MKKAKTVLLALCVMALWGSLYPGVKIGYTAFGIDGRSVADILLFASLRFFLCGLLVTGYCLCRRKTVPMPGKKSVRGILLVGVFAIILHYAFSYIGLSTTDSSKTALLKQSGSLIYVCFAFLFFKDEEFSIYKLLGALIGFCGVMAINVGPGTLRFSPGDVLILGSSACTVAANIMSRRFGRQVSPLWMTGLSQLFGGLVLLVVALAMGGRLPRISWEGVLVFAYICAASILSYTLWYSVQKNSELSKLFIIKFAEPAFACVIGAVLLGENIFRLQYLLAFLLISLGILTGHHSAKRRQKL